MTNAVLSPEISFLASNAAVELDHLINGEETELKSVRSLGERLRTSVTNQAQQCASQRLYIADTATETILGEAFINAGGADGATILKHLLAKTQEVVDQLSSAESSSEKRALEWQRAFCLALSRSASNYRQLVINARPPHPNRR